VSQAGDSRPTDAPITDVDESTRITTDLPCMKCGYNLRTLPLAGRCPECGVPVERTTRGNLLRFSDPKWIAGLSGGVQCWLAALLVFLLGISLAAITIGLGARAKAGRFIVVPTMTTVGVLALVGLWKLTSPEPDRLKHPSRMSVGTVARYAASASCVLTAVNTCATISDASLDLLSEVAVFLTVAGTIVAFLIHLQQLAARLPPPQARQADAPVHVACRCDDDLLLRQCFRAFDNRAPGSGASSPRASRISRQSHHRMGDAYSGLCRRCRGVCVRAVRRRPDSSLPPGI